MATHAHTTSSIGRVLLGLAVLWGMIGLAGARSWASDSAAARATLRGLQGVEVVVEALAPDVEQAGLTTPQLHTDVEERLRQAGIPVLTAAESLGVPGHPFLYINVNVLLRADGLAVFHLTVEVNQEASLTTDASVARVFTWRVGTLGTMERAHLSTVRTLVRAAVDRFITAYVSVHPRPAGRATPSTPAPTP
jgi:hypothetical protein